MGVIGVTGCSTTLGPHALDQTRLNYNEVVKSTSEQQLLLNIVRLRYTDTPSSLAVSAIAAQFERTQSLQLTPFFTSAGADITRSYTSILPQPLIEGADRPTFTLTPLDDQEFTRKLFTPLPLDGVIYLAKTTWPISTVFRLYLENLNWVSNAQTASGPTPIAAPDVTEFLRGISAMQALQDRSQLVFSTEEREEQIGSALPVKAVGANDLLEAAKNGYEYQKDKKHAAWILIRKKIQPVLRIAPEAVDSPEMLALEKIFHLKAGLTQYDITEESLNPFPSTLPSQGVTNIDLETRSLLQALYYVSLGVDIPPEHAKQRLITVTLEPDGKLFDWASVMNHFFRVHSVKGKDAPPNAQVAIQYRGYWFYIDETDQQTKSTFSLLMELARLELSDNTSHASPQLTLPLSGR